MLTRDEIRKYLDRLEYDKIPAPDLKRCTRSSGRI